jgi:hypothetical protein
MKSNLSFVSRFYQVLSVSAACGSISSTSNIELTDPFEGEPSAAARLLIHGASVLFLVRLMTYSASTEPTAARNLCMYRHGGLVKPGFHLRYTYCKYLHMGAPLEQTSVLRAVIHNSSEMRPGRT